MATHEHERQTMGTQLFGINGRIAYESIEILKGLGFFYAHCASVRSVVRLKPERISLIGHICGLNESGRRMGCPLSTPVASTRF